MVSDCKTQRGTGPRCNKKTRERNSFSSLWVTQGNIVDFSSTHPSCEINQCRREKQVNKKHVNVETSNIRRCHKSWLWCIVTPYLSLWHCPFIMWLRLVTEQDLLYCKINTHSTYIQCFYFLYGWGVMGEWVPLHETHSDRCVTYGMCSYIMNGSRCNSLWQLVAKAYWRAWTPPLTLYSEVYGRAGS